MKIQNTSNAQLEGKGKKKKKSKIQLNKQCPVAVKPKTKRNSQPKKYKTKAICIQRVQKLLPWVFLWNTIVHFSLPFSLQFGKIGFWSSKEKTPKSYRNLSRFSALTKQPQIPFSPYSLFIIFYPPIITLIEPQQLNTSILKSQMLSKYLTMVHERKY